MIYLVDSGVDINYVPDVVGDIVDTHGHGTSMAYLIKKMHPEAEIMSVKMAENDATLTQVVGVLEELLELEPGIVSINWVIPRHKGLEELFDKVTKKHYLVCSAGNSYGCVDDYLPACCEKAITVGSLNKKGSITKHCNKSKLKEIDLYFPGTNIETVNIKTGLLEKKTGTSVSSALAAGVISKKGLDTSLVKKNETYKIKQWVCDDSEIFN